MKTRNADTSKSAAKKTPPAKKSAVKTPLNPPESVIEAVTPNSGEPKRVSAVKARQVKKEPEAITTPVTAVKAGASGDGAKVKKVKKVTKLVAKRTVVKSKRPNSSKDLGAQTTKSVESSKGGVEEAKEVEVSVESMKGRVEEAKEVEVTVAKDIGTVNVEPVVENAEEFCVKERTVVEVGCEQPSSRDGGTSENDVKVEVVVSVESSSIQGKPLAEETEKSSENEKSAGAMEKDDIEEEPEEDVEEEPEEEENAKDMDDGENAGIQPVNVEKNVEELQGTSQAGSQELARSEEMEERTDKMDLVEHVEEEPREYNQEDCAEKTETLEEECQELSAITKERKINQEREIFVGGLDGDVVEEDLKKVFEKIGEVVEVRLHKNSSGNKNKGYAFVKFTNKEHVKRALAEMKNPVIRGRRCGTAPSEDNRTLFVGNICNTWTKEAIKKKLKHYKIDGVENITLVQDVQHEGLSRGFAFIEFSCHGDAMLAYKRLQKADVIFGHTERTVKVAFAEPLSDPDPEMMAQVKSVFVDGIPPHWNEEHIRDKLKGYGEIVRIVLARNMSKAKRKDFGFVDFSTHEAAVACIDGINNPGFGDGKKKTKVKARLLNPLPKTQAVKGGMSGGFRIGQSSGGSSRSDRSLGKGSTHFQRGRSFQHVEWGQSGRVGFPNNFHIIDDLPLDFHGRQSIGRGGRMESFQGGHFDYGRGVAISGLSRPIVDGLWHGTPEGGFGFHASPRSLPFRTQREFERPFIGQHVDDPYLFDDNAPGMKRPFSMIDPSSDYVEPSRFRQRLDYSDPVASFQGNRYLDGYRAGSSGSSLYPPDYYAADVGRGSYSSFHGGHQTYRGGYYY